MEKQEPHIPIEIVNEHDKTLKLIEVKIKSIRNKSKRKLFARKLAKIDDRIYWTLRSHLMDFDDDVQYRLKLINRAVKKLETKFLS